MLQIPRLPRAVRIVIALAAGFVLAIVVVELGLRFVLFSDTDTARQLGARLRHAANFGDPDSEDDYWKLHRRFADPARRTGIPRFDPVVGWTGHHVKSGTYEPEEPCADDGRQLVLLYGDSFAACNTPPGQQFQDICARSDLDARYCLTNCGVGGYGLDQIYLLIQRSIDLHRERDPIVIVGILAENDLDRSVLSFRDWPKPRLAIEGERLVQREPVIEGVDAYLEQHPPSIRSYLHRLFLYRENVVPWRVREWLKGDHGRIGEKTALNRRILEEIERELASRKLRHFYLLFHAENAVLPHDYELWQEPFINSVCASLGATVISTRPYLVAAAGGDPLDCRRFYGHAGRLDGHLTAAGNVVAFQAIRDGIDGRRDPIEPARVRERVLADEIGAGIAERTQRTLWGRNAQVTTRARDACLREEPDASGKVELVCVRAGDWGPTEIELDLAEVAQRFHARVHARADEGATVDDDVTLVTIHADERTVLRATAIRGPNGLGLDLDLRGVARLRIVVESRSGGPGREWLCVTELAIQ